MAADPPAPFLHLGHPDPHIPKFEAPHVPSQMVPPARILLLAAVGIALAFLGQWFHHLGEHAPTPSPHAAWLAPFVLLLLAIAIMPFAARHFWEHHYHHVAVALALLVAAYYVFVLPSPPQVGGGANNFFTARSGPALARNLADYISFIFLLGTLFILSGGVLIRVRRAATPAANTLLLLSGALLANVLGTTGAAMLLIRPWLRINHNHLQPYHLVFFIFLVANVGGCLTPIGDPPLFLGYLKGVPFWWVVQHCWPMWALAVGILLLIFFILDTRFGRNQTRKPDSDDLGPAVSIYGAVNLVLIAFVVAGLVMHDSLAELAPLPWREIIMVAAVAISLGITPHRIHVENVFNFAPIREVAFLFLGIFATMAPALNFLSNHAPQLAKLIHTPGQYYFATGTLSSVLDNAPTYMTFLEAQAAQVPNAAALSEQEQIQLILADPQRAKVLLAISLAAVFFGALTYIGNGPNFMVRSIAESSSLRPPSFFEYTLRYALPILLPILVIIWAMFLR